jgi:alpha-1,6-mannosyltransferase
LPTSPPSARRPTASQLGALLLTGAAYWGLAYATPRPQFGQMLALLAVAGAAYVWLLRTRLPLRWGLGAALVFRLLWLPATPALSDDFYRFRWDGLLVSHGHNPFAKTPRQLLTAPPADSAALPMPELRRLLPQLNSPAYFSVYPPVCQALYGTAARLFPTSQTGFLLVVRLALLLADAGATALLLWLLPLAGWPSRRALAYLLHPLVVVEVAGNVHMEGVVVCFLLLAGALLVRSRLRLAAGALALAVATKLLPLLVLPLLARRLSWRQLWQFMGVLVGCVALLFLPFFSWRLLLHIGLSLDLYFQSFEFNASVFYVLLALGKWLAGYDLVGVLGPLLGLTAASLSFWLARRAGRPTLAALPHWLLLTLSGYFALATIVHPWYLVLLVALSCFSPLRYARVWAGLAVLSYSAYRTSAYTESGFLLTLEYGVVLAWAIGEYYVGRWRQPASAKAARLPRGRVHVVQGR